MDTTREADHFKLLIETAEAAAFGGWDFDYIDGRWQEETPPWSYRATVQEQLPIAQALLDMGTGGGEFLASLVPLPLDTVATEAYPPNIPVAQARLAPLGIEVVALSSDDLPFADQRFDLIINRHESFNATELYRVLRPGGFFITQQVGGRDNIQLNTLLGSTHTTHEYAAWDLLVAHQQLTDVGFEMIAQGEAFPATRFYDIGALVYYLRAIPWQIPDFSVARYEPALYDLHRAIQTTGALKVDSHRFFLHAQRPLR